MADVLVRWARVDGIEPDPGLVDEAARARLSALRSAADRRRFVGARLLLRQVVADAVGCRPGAVALRQRCPRCGGPHGRPVVDVPGRRAPSVSVAHAGDLAVVALAARPVGVDIEPRTGHDDLRTWTRTEAVLKAAGVGLDVDPALVGLTPPSSPPRLVAWRGPGRRPVLRLLDLDAPPGYVGAVARLGRRRLHLDAGEVLLTLP